MALDTTQMSAATCALDAGHHEPMFNEGKLWHGHRLKLSHSFGVYPAAIYDCVIAHGDDAFVFCSGRHIAIADHVRQKLSFLQRETKNRLVTAMAKSPNGKVLAVAEKMGETDGGSAQICIFPLPKIEGAGADKVNTTSDSLAKEGKHGDALKVLFPQNRKLDIIGLAFTANDAKFLVSLSSMPDSTITYWRWDVDKILASKEIKQPVTRMQLNPNNGGMLSVSGPRYLRVWEYNSINHSLQESPSMFPVQQEKQMNIVDHCWVLGAYLCAATDDGHVHLFEEGEQGPEHRVDVPVHEIIAKDESTGPKAVEKEQAKLLAKMGMGARSIQEPPKVKLQALAAWGRGFVVGGDQGYLGVFKVDSRLQVESFGTFRMPGESATIWQMCSGSEDTYLTIYSYTEPEEDDLAPSQSRHGSKAAAAIEDEKPKDRIWHLSTFPVGQADLAATGQLEVFVPVYPLGTHHSEILSLTSAGHRRVFATCGADMQLKVWGYPATDEEPGGFTSQLSFPCSTYEKPKACSIHPLGFQVAIILEDVLRVYHLTTQQMTRTLFDLSLKHPGDVAYSNSGNMLAVTAGNDVLLLDPWRQSLIHSFSGQGGHLSTVNQILFSDNDQMLLSCGDDKHGAIYGWELETEEKEKAFEHISKGTNYSCMAYDLQRKLVVACTKPDGCLRVIENLSSSPLQLEPEPGHAYTTINLCVPLKALFAGTEQGAIRIFRWPLREGGAASNPYTEFSLHAHSITALQASYDLRYLFSSCSGGAAMACRIESVVAGRTPLVLEDELNAQQIAYRHRQDGPKKRKPNKEETRKIEDLKKKLSSTGQVVSATTASLDEMIMVPKSFFTERLEEIKDLEERMRNQQNENEYALEQKDQETQEKLNSIHAERKHERRANEEKYDALFVQHTKSLERADEAAGSANARFEMRNRELQDQFDDRISKEYEKQSRLLGELKDMREKQEVIGRDVEQSHDTQLNELRKKQEKDMREWRTSYDQVCNLLKSDGLKFEEALHQQENEYEEQISEMMEHKRVALQVESEKSTTALKDGVSMKQTINMLQKQRKGMDEELFKIQEECKHLRRELADSQKINEEVKNQLQECKRGLLVKDDNLRKLREQMKHLESFRFVLFHKVRALEDERDPLEEQVELLKSNVGNMYDEFVREFRQKQDLSQEFQDKKNLALALQEENVRVRAQLTQLKKDGRRLINEMEQVLHPDTCSEFEKLPKQISAVLARHQHLLQWEAPKDSDRDDNAVDPFADPGKEASIIQEMVTQRDLLFRKNQIAVGAASQSKRECAQDVRRLTSENAALIAEMNTLRNERKTWQRSYKELEAKMMASDAENNAKARVAGKSTNGDGMNRNASAPALDSSTGNAQGGKPRSREKVADTPYVRRKVVDQQEVYRRQKQKGMNQLPPVSQGATMPGSENARMKPTVQEKRFTQSLDQVQAGKSHMERQGFDMGSLRHQAQAMASHLPLQATGVSEPVSPEGGGEQGSFPVAEGIQG